MPGGGRGCYPLSDKGRRRGRARAPTLINNLLRALNSRGLFKTDAPGNDLFTVLTYCALSTARVVLYTYQQNPAAGIPFGR